MGFDVYPAAATPLHLASGANSGLVAFNAHVSSEVTPTMYIRVAMSDAICTVPTTGVGHDPTVTLQVDAGAPTAIPITGFTVAVDNGSGNEADASMVYDANGVYLIKVFFVPPETLPSQFHNWKIQITNNDPDAAGRDFTWVVSDNDTVPADPFNPLTPNTSAQQPWMTITPTTISYDVLINQDPMTSAESVHITNKGTLTLTIKNVTPALGASFTLPAFPITILPCGCTDLPITFNAPAAIGTSTASFKTVCDDPTAGHNPLITLNTTTQRS